MMNTPYFRCTACNSEMSPKKKKPLTTYSGSMNSIYTDKVEDFPKDMFEDLCPACARQIKNYNAKFYSPNPEGKSDFTPEEYFVEYMEMYPDDVDTEMSEMRLDTGFEVVNNVYEGYRDT